MPQWIRFWSYDNSVLLIHFLNLPIQPVVYIICWNVRLPNANDVHTMFYWQITGTFKFDKRLENSAKKWLEMVLISLPAMVGLWIRFINRAGKCIVRKVDNDKSELYRFVQVNLTKSDWEERRRKKVKEEEETVAIRTKKSSLLCLLANGRGKRKCGLGGQMVRHLFLHFLIY